MEQFNNQSNDRELGWDDEIVNDSQFIDIPDGEYDFVVEAVDRSRFPGSVKMPPCNQAKLSLILEVPGIGQASLTTNLMLHSKLEWKLSEFFASIGLKRKDEPLKMRWNIHGAKGRCKIGHREHDGNTYNEVKKFIPLWDVKKQPVQSNQNYGGYQPGQF